MTKGMDGQVTWSDLGFSFGKMYPVHSAATGEETSKPCWRKLSTSQSLPFLYLDLRGNGQRQEPLTVMGGLSLGELMMLNTGESPNAAVESRLSQILEENPQEKYYLSAKACLGILRRAERRGKDLPKLLKQVLLMQSESGGGCDGGGKGALVQEDKSGTLGTGNDQTIFCYGISAYESNAMKSSNPHSGIYEAETARTLDLNGGSPACNQGGMAVVCAGFKPNNGEKARSIGYGEDQSPTLNAESKPAVLCLNDQGGNVMGVSHDVSGTIRAQEHGHQPTILDMSHACDVIRDCGEVVPNLQAIMGTGGNQVQLTYGIGNGQANEASIMAEEVSQTLNTMHDAHAVMCEDVSHMLLAKANCAYRDDAETYICSAVDCWNGKESDVGGTLQARTGHTLNANGVVRSNMVVRRLTPLECTRLQGYPDGWVDIGDWTDENGKKHKDADSPKYKALGNSIALPFWYWMFCRMAEHLPVGATLGSLFDGIGGFPLCWENIHGKGTARWASEIEKFPIAVTKLRFPEEA